MSRWFFCDFAKLNELVDFFSASNRFKGSLFLSVFGRLSFAVAIASDAHNNPRALNFSGKALKQAKAVFVGIFLYLNIYHIGQKMLTH
mgnify:CR=1 FL=1